MLRLFAFLAKVFSRGFRQIAKHLEKQNEILEKISVQLTIAHGKGFVSMYNDYDVDESEILGTDDDRNAVEYYRDQLRRAGYDLDAAIGSRT